jgi:hypothetical protein
MYRGEYLSKFRYLPMFTDLASSDSTIDASDLDVTILATRLSHCFSSIQDYCSMRTLLYQLSDILNITVLDIWQTN